MFTPWSFSPLVLRPALWLDASDASTLWNATSGGSLVAAGGSVVRWEDKSGNGRHATQSTGVSQPTRQTGVTNGRDVIRFDGSNDYLSITTGLNSLRNVAGGSIFAVFKWNANPTSNSTLILVATSLSAARLVVGGGITSRKPFFGGRRLDADAFQRIDGAADNLTGFHMYGGVCSYANQTLRQYINGSLDGSTNSFQTSGNTSNTDSSPGIVIGANTALVTPFTGDICEIIMLPFAATDTERFAIQSYLKTKWGTP